MFKLSNVYIREFLYTVLFAGIGLTTLNPCVHGQTEKTFLGRPNILFIFVDDLRPELGCYGHEQIISPNIDRLAKRGQLFLRAYTDYPSCGPARASLLSGLYSSRSRWNSWNASQDQEVPGIVSLPMYLKNNGYQTIALGKVYNDFGDGRGSWDKEWQPPLTTTPWDYQTKEGISIFRKQNDERAKNLEVRDHHNLPRRGPAFEKANVKDMTYLDGRTANKAVEELQRLQHSPDPFFLAVGFHKPHLPFNAPVRYWKLYDKKDIELPDNMYQPEGAPDVSTSNFYELRAYYGIPEKGPIPDSLARKLIHGYYACVSYMDQQVGKVLNALEVLGLSDHTIIILTADHGWSLGEHGLWSKHTAYKESVHIPLIVKVPGKKTSVRQQGLVENIDIYPTLCDLVGLPKPFHLQGQSFAKKLDSSEIVSRKAVFVRSPTGNAETIITENYSYTEFFDGYNKIVARMLYDLRKDPEENMNISERLENKDLVHQLSEKLHKHIEGRNIIRIH